MAIHLFLALDYDDDLFGVLIQFRHTGYPNPFLIHLSESVEYLASVLISRIVLLTFPWFR